MNSSVEKVVIVGGGSAGWLTAGIIAARHKGKISITLVESPDVNTIGVGEGTWPSMRSTLKAIGISETEFLRRCSASFKQGSQFVGWHNNQQGDQYLHPFTLPAVNNIPALVSAWKKNFPMQSFAEVASIQASVAKLSLAPKLITTPEYSGVQNYGYHLDAAAFVQLIQEHCCARLGVLQIVDHVVSVESFDDGSISNVNLKSGKKVCGDIFIDCSGLSSLLIGQHLQVPFVSASKYSVNDRAIAVQVPYESENQDIASVTVATALENGWTWDIGLTNRRGVGYVYSSAYVSEENAQAQFLEFLARKSSQETLNALSFKKLEIQPGYREKMWHRNCVAVGMSAGFVEPLEASALAMVELSANFIRDELPTGKELLPSIARKFNEVFLYRWQRIIEFLQLHYVLSSRHDTPYWRDMSDMSRCTEELTEKLKKWSYRVPYFRDFMDSEEIFPVASYQYVMLGMGFNSDSWCTESAEDEVSTVSQEIYGHLEKTKQYCSRLPTNRDLLAKIRNYGLSSV